jgi:hypothetical protein
MGQLTFQATLGGAINLAGPNTASTTTFTLPAADGTNGQALTTNGSGTLAFATVGASAATPTVEGTVYGKMTASGGTPFLTALGYNAGVVNTGVNNTFTGVSAGLVNTSGTDNVAVGYQSFKGNITGSNNTSIGVQALQANTTDRNTAVGYQAAYTTVSGYDNVAVGVEAHYTNNSGIQNVAVGNMALRSSVNGGYNVAIGKNALYANTTDNNTAVGFESLKATTTGSGNTSVGMNSENAITTGNQNTAVGRTTHSQLTTGSYNVCLGHGSGEAVATGTYCIAVGYGTAHSGSAVNYELVIGTNAQTGKGSSTGFISAASGSMYQGNNTTTWTTTSDRRLKKNIVDNTVGLSAINSIRVRNFEYRVEDEITELPTHAAIKKSGVQLGVIAQELQAVLPDCVKQESTGVLSVQSDNLTWYMINAIKELKAQNDLLQARLDAANL